ncbi:low molecular weight protein-tyrosine-phosphatase [Alteromonadaceae bacterium BrNp21-10]|nr:low molecular weight protein-tyrosine-phosphatase [Alteromonadaceae bacterium BrNp21-10]
MTDLSKITSILFVCMGNICRSPTAEAVFRHKALEHGLDLRIDSAGTQGFHKNAKPDVRSVAAGTARGYNFDGLKARRIAPSDFESFDLVVAMDNSNLSDLRDICPMDMQHKIQLFMSFCESSEVEVPDPYYGGAKGFDYVLDLVEQAADGLIENMRG